MTSIDDDYFACASTSDADCGSCYTNQRRKVEGRSRCVAMCTSKGLPEQCKRLSLDDNELDMCLQHNISQVEQLTRRQLEALFTFVDTKISSDRRVQIKDNIRTRLLPPSLRDIVTSYVLSRDDQFTGEILRRGGNLNTIESIEVMRNIYKLDTTVTLLKDTDRNKNLDPTLQYHIWCTDVKKTNLLIRRRKLTDVTILSLFNGSFNGTIGDRCKTLENIRFVMPWVTEVEGVWLKGCVAIKNVLFDTPRLEPIHYNWFSDIGGAKTVTFDGVPQESHKLERWIKTYGVVSVDFGGLKKLNEEWSDEYDRRRYF